MEGSVLLLSSSGGPYLPRRTLRLYVPHQAHKETSLPDIHFLFILARISLALHTPNVFVRTTWLKTSDLSEFQFLLSLSYHTATSIAINRHPTAPEVMEYQMADCAAIRRQQRCHTAPSRTPPYSCDLSL